MPHDHGEHTAPDNDGSLAYRLEDYMTSGSFLMELGSFVAKHASMFEDVNTGEHPHQWFETYREYEAMLSKRVRSTHFLRPRALQQRRQWRIAGWPERHTRSSTSSLSTSLPLSTTNAFIA
mmetsp:Transcript_39380/g.91304  ORF Transcript_39380/g.91304 Transcript_39380/m.91304 type:complete len:121 (-) Transcript_39380:144-506(-)